LTQLIPTKAVCVARNWRGHIRELGNVEPSEPPFFHKPLSAFRPLSEPIHLPHWSSEVHHEVELALRIDQRLCGAGLEQVAQSVGAVALALDLTARDVQNRLKAQGLPWEKAKSFDGSLPLGPWIPITEVGPLEELELRLEVNERLRQQGKLALMIHSPFAWVAEASRYFTLEPGDVVLTGTPEGVASLRAGDKLVLTLSGHWRQETRVAHD